MANQKNKNHGGVPNHLLNQLIEHTAGGFIIFYFNSESGSPEHAMTFDSPAHCLALQKYITDWAIALGDINIENARHDIEKAVGEDPEGLNGQDS
jgi:hypothetical protein